MNTPSYTLECPECKNAVDVSPYESLSQGDVIECNHCGITLEVQSIASDGAVAVEIIEEGK